MTLVFMFPGQNSRYPGMLDKLVEIYPPCAQILEKAGQVLGRDLRVHYRADNTDAFARNEDVQVGVFLASYLFMEVLAAGGVQAEVSLGLSLGEYNHLVHIGALRFEDALLVVRDRGRAYEQGPCGWMAAVQPIELKELLEVFEQARVHGLVEIVNLNSPTQHVIAGEEKAVEAAIDLLEEDYFAEGIVIERRFPVHSSLFKGVAARFRRVLEKTPFQHPERPYVPNHLGQVLPRPGCRDFIERLSRHVCSPVLWRASIEHVAQGWPDAVFVEVGPYSVLCNLMNRRWCKNRKLHTDSKEETSNHLAAVIGELGGCLPRDWNVAC